MTEMISDDSVVDTMISIRIKTTNSSKEIALTVAGSSKVDEIKRLVMIELGLVGQEDKYVRLIASGKMLADGNTLATYNITNGAFIHAVISDKKPNSVINNTNNGIEMTTMNSNSISMSNLNGLDVLLAEGLSVDEVAAIRSYFRTSIDEYASRDDRLQIREGENNVAYRARIEEAWMNAQPPHSEFILNLPLDSPRRLGLGNMSGSRTNPLLLSFIRGFVNQNRENREILNNNNSVMLSNDESLGSTRDFVFGIFFGVFFGFMSLLCVWDHNIPFRQKVGILIGVMIQLIMGTLVNSPNAASPPSNTNSNTNSNSNSNNNNSVNNAITGLEPPLPTGN